MNHFETTHELLCHTIIHYTNLHIVFDNAIIVSDDVIVDIEFFEVSYNNYRLFCIYHNSIIAVTYKCLRNFEV